jgi:hypothetical protein
MHNTDRTLLAFGRAMAAWARIEVGFYASFEHITAFDMRQAKPIYYSARCAKEIEPGFETFRTDPHPGASCDSSDPSIRALLSRKRKGLRRARLFA